MKDVVARLNTLVPERDAALQHLGLSMFVSSDVDPLVRALGHIRDNDLCEGAVFCELGSGLGFAAMIAALFDFEAYGIEIHPELVDASRELASAVDVDAKFGLGTYLLAGDEDLLEGSRYESAETGTGAYDELGIAFADCDFIFNFPWPGDEMLTDALFMRHSKPGALLLTFHDNDRMLLQRHVPGEVEATPLGWV